MRSASPRHARQILLVGVPEQPAESANNFVRFAGGVLSHRCTLTQASRALALLIIDACIVQRADLESAYGALAGAYRVKTTVFLEWTSIDRNRTERRAIGAHLQILLGQIRELPSYRQAVQELESWLTGQVQLANFPTQFSSPLEKVLGEAQAFARLSLPNALFGQVCGIVPLTLLPRSCLARLATGQALQFPESDPEDSTDQVPDRTYERAIDAALLGQSSMGQSAPAFIRRLLSALRPPSHGSVASRRAAISQALSGLESAVEGHCTAVQILFAHAIHLHMNGTPQQGQLAPATPYDYLQAIAVEFLNEFSELHFERLETPEFTERFVRLWSVSSAPKYGAACRSLYVFMRQWDLVPKIKLGTISSRELQSLAAEVHANVIHPHEIDKLFGWLEHCGPSRLNQSLQCALAILEAVPMRVGELISLRLEGMRVGNDHIELDIAPKLSDPRLKSRESRRRALVAAPRGVMLIGTWWKRRVAEERRATNEIGDAPDATPLGYLFGDPNVPNLVYRPAAMSLLLNRSLKSITGDPSVSVHTLRHSWATRAITRELTSPASGEVNGLEVIAMTMGHSDVTTSIVNYFHTPERVVLQHWTRGLESHLRTNSFELAHWIGVSAATCRQRLRRWPGTLTTAREAHHDRLRQFTRDALDRAASQVQLGGAESGIALGDHRFPSLDSQGFVIGLTTILGTLTDISCGLGTSQVALRQQLHAIEVEQVIDLVVQASRVLTYQTRRSHDTQAFGVEMLLDAKGRGLGFRPDFRRMNQDRWRPLFHWLQKNWNGPVARAASDYWLSHCGGEQLALDLSAFDFLNIFALAGCNPSLAHLNINCDAGNLTADDRQLLHAMEVLFHQSFGQVYTTRFLSPRRGRPLFMFAFGKPSQRFDRPQQSGAAHSLVGLHCLMLATWVLQRFQRRVHD